MLLNHFFPRLVTARQAAAHLTTARQIAARGHKSQIRYALGLAALSCASFAHADSFQFDPIHLTLDTRPRAVAVADLDGDGRDDLILAGTNPADQIQELYVFFQATDGTLSPPISLPYGATYPFNVSMAVGDFDNDGISDVLVGHSDGYSLVRGNSSRILDVQLTPAPTSVAVLPIDINLDGNLDFLLMDNGTALNLHTYRGDGTGAFVLSDQATLPGSGGPHLKLGRLDSNGSLDLAYTHGSDEVSLYMQKRRGFDVPALSLTAGYDIWGTGGVAIGDFNNDGRNDVVTGKSSNSPTFISIYYGAAQGGFETPVTRSTYDIPGPMLARDFNGDGKDDLVVEHNGGGRVGLYLQGDSGLGSEVLYEANASRDAASIAYGDLNNDGCNDVVTAWLVTGATILYGDNCQRPAELADIDVEASLRARDAIIRLNNRSGSVPVASPLVDVTISFGRNEVEVTTLPAGCALRSQNRRSRSYTCLVDTLNPGDTALLDFTFEADRSQWNVIGLSGRASTDTPESDTTNNAASTSLALPPAPVAGPKAAPGTQGPTRSGAAGHRRRQGR